MSLDNRPKKLWKGKKRLALKHLWKGKRHVLEWAITISPGDWIATCEGTNRQVKEVEYSWFHVGKRTKVLSEVWFTDTRGGTHCCPGGGCALPKETIPEIETYYKGWIEAVNEDPDCISGWDPEGKFKRTLEGMQKKFEEGNTIVDEHGELLPEFDRKQRES